MKIKDTDLDLAFCYYKIGVFFLNTNLNPFFQYFSNVIMLKILITFKRIPNFLLFIYINLTGVYTYKATKRFSLMKHIYLSHGLRQKNELVSATV